MSSNDKAPHPVSVDSRLRCNRRVPGMTRWILVVSACLHTLVCLISVPERLPIFGNLPAGTEGNYMPGVEIENPAL